MTIKEAQEAAHKALPMSTFTYAIETEHYFVFFVDKRALQGAYMVNKESGAVSSYTPLRIPVDELKAARAIKIAASKP